MSLGTWGEDLAERYLGKEGFQILERNYRCRIGELDLIALDGNCIVFVEVKTRQSQSYGLPCEAVNQEKIRHIRRTAAYYLTNHPFDAFDQRIDVIEILKIKEKKYLRHVRNITG